MASDFQPKAFTEGQGHPEPPRQKKPKRNRTAVTAGVIIGLLALLVLLVVLAPAGQQGRDGWDSRGAAFHDTIMAIDVDGVIEEAGATYNQAWLEGAIEEARMDKRNKAILLRIDSPGGTIYESDAAWRALMKYKKETGRPVYAYAEHLMASGGYYIASAADNIAADRNSIVGSIGVIGGRFVDAAGLFDKLGLKFTTIHTGANKLMGDPSEPPTEEQVAIMQSMSDEAYAQFVDIVAQGRDMDPEAVKTLADGRVYTARQGLANGLLDEVMTYDEYEEKVKKDLKGKGIMVVERSYEAPVGWGLFPLGQSLADLLQTAVLGNDLSAALQTVKDLQITEPMYLYQ
ncbi:signal peptide peptidase SppA [Peptococcus simiae]|uniref:Signal peptide peptidase SppA n=1 Tax=Peptococcus simiae TaxID=1643805 RepID=A0ABW9GZP7_9FIRM